MRGAPTASRARTRPADLLLGKRCIGGPLHAQENGQMTPSTAPFVAIAAAIFAYLLGGDVGWAAWTGIFVFGVSFFGL